MKLTEADRERLRKAFEQQAKPPAPPRPVPKSIPKKRGRPTKEEA